MCAQVLARRATPLVLLELVVVLCQGMGLGAALSQTPEGHTSWCCCTVHFLVRTRTGPAVCALGAHRCTPGRQAQNRCHTIHAALGVPAQVLLASSIVAARGAGSRVPHAHAE